MLYLLNVSNRDRLSSDSGWIVADALASAWQATGAQVTVAGPVPVSDPDVGYVPVEWPATKYRVRFEPCTDDIVAAIVRSRPDLIVACQIETAAAVRVAMMECASDAVLAVYLEAAA